jgi:AcrR family transcriptional regulator
MTISFSARATEPGNWAAPLPGERASKQISSPQRRHPAANGRSLERILDGAIAILSRRGAAQLSMSAVCEAAGVSRATLYRYFARKEDLLEAVGEHVSRNFVQGINRAVAESRTPAERLRLVLEFFIRYTAQVKSDRMLEIEPTFVLKFLQSHFPQHLAVFTDALAPVYDDIEAHLGIPVNRSLVSEVLLRAEQSTVVVPAGRSWDALPAALSRMLEQLYRAKQGTSRRRRKPR